MSSRSLNLVQVIGNLTRDAELRYTPNGTAVATMSVATNRSWTAGEGGERQEEVMYHRVVVWSKLAEICGKIMKKGGKVYVQGRLQSRKWQTKEGQERETTEIVADNVLLLSSSGPREEGAGNESAYAYPEQKGNPAETDVASAPDTDMSVQDVSDDIPF